MSIDRLMRIHSAEFQAMAERVLRVTELTSRLNVLPFEDEVDYAGIRLGARVMVGPKVMFVLPGVSIGRDAVIAAGAVVTDDVPPASLVTGSKASVHRRW